jgi:ABC-type amino acid transport substrate-binding protein
MNQPMQRRAPDWQGLFYISIGIAVVSLLLSLCALSHGGGESKLVAGRENALHRIKREGVIKVAYAGFPPYAIINPNEQDPDKRLSGFAVDLIREVAARNVPPLKIEWKNMNWETVKADLDAGKFDVVVEPLYSTVPRAMEMGFVEPYSYFGLALAVVRKDDNRFHKFADLDRPDITIALSEGWTTGEYAKSWLHKPKFKSIPVGGDAFIQVDDVLLGRSDVALNDSPTVVQYAKAHSDRVKVLFLDKPPALVPGGFTVRSDEPELLQFFNTCMRIFRADGTISSLDKKWHTYGYLVDEKLVPAQGLADYLKGQ